MNAGKGARDLPASAARRARCVPTFSYAVGVHRRSSASYKIRHRIYGIVYLVSHLAAAFAEAILNSSSDSWLLTPDFSNPRARNGASN
jgi:hypothetical protein